MLKNVNWKEEIICKKRLESYLWKTTKQVFYFLNKKK